MTADILRSVAMARRPEAVADCLAMARRSGDAAPPQMACSMAGRSTRARWRRMALALRMAQRAECRCATPRARNGGEGRRLAHASVWGMAIARRTAAAGYYEWAAVLRWLWMLWWTLARMPWQVEWHWDRPGCPSLVDVLWLSQELPVIHRVKE